MWRSTISVLVLVLAFAKYSLSQSRNGTSCDWNSPLFSEDCPISQEELDYMAENLMIQVNSIDNLKDDGNTHIIQIRLHNNGTRVIRGKSWQLFFHSFFMVEPEHLPMEKAYVDDDYKVSYKHVTGSLFSLSPVEGFKDILPNGTRTIEHEAKFWAVSKSDFLPNWYLKAPMLEPRLIASTNSSYFAGEISSAKQWKRFKYDRYNPFTSPDRYERFYTPHRFTNGPSVIPTPRLFFESRSFGEFFVDDTWTIGSTKGTRKAAKLLSSELNLPLKDLINGRSISLRLIDNNKGPEWYSIESNINAPSIIINANSQAGLFYGVQTLVSLLDRFRETRSKALFPFYLEDEPRYEYRGLRLDVVRHFRTKEEVKRLIDLISMYKLNKLILMLSNDEGWRIEIPSYPELVQVGARRCFDLEEEECLLPQIGNPINTAQEYYTAADYIEILQHAKDRNVEVIPEINFPGHAYALKRAIESRFKDTNKTLWSPPDKAHLSVQMFEDNMLNPCSPVTYELLETILTQIAAYHQRAGVPLQSFHTGGDDHYSMDRWVLSEDCQKVNMHSSQAIQNMFDSRVSRLIENTGANVLGFADGFMNANGVPQDPRLFRTPEVTAHYWNNHHTADFANGYKLANAGYKVVLGPVSHLYFDHPYEPNPEENGLYWATRFTDTRKVFSFEPENIYRAIKVKKTGDPISQLELCGRNRERCPRLLRPENIKGVEGSLYGELIRSRDMMDYMLFPRILGLAERAWHKGAWEDIEDDEKRKEAMNDDWQRFARIVGSKELRRLDDLGVKYRISPAGAKSDGIKRMYTNTEFPDQVVEYSTNSGEKWKTVPKDWLMKSYNSRILVRAVPKVGRIKANTDHMTERMEYSVNQGKTWRLVPDTWPIASYNPILLRTRSADGKRLSRETEFDPRGVNPIPNQADVENIAKSLRVTYELEDNLVDEENSFLFRITFHNTGNETLTYGNYSIYMYNIRLLQPIQSPYPNGYKLHDCSLWLHHVSGSLYRLDPEQPDFKIPPGQSLSCLITGKSWQVSRTDSMPNWFVAGEGMDPVVINNTVSEDLSYVSKFDTSNKWKRYPDDQYNPYSPPTRFGIFKDIADRGRAVKPVIPSPKNLKMNPYRQVRVGGPNNRWFILRNGRFPVASKDLTDHFNLQTIGNWRGGRNIVLLEKTEEIRNNEGYSIEVDPSSNKIILRARDDPGMFYAVQTLKALADRNGNAFILPEVTIFDEPRFPYRGMHLDVARNFHSKEEVMKLLDLMAKYKLNKLHLHLTDDEGWRIEVPQLPELTQIGSQRCFDIHEEECILPQIGSAPLRPNTGTGYYTAEDYRDILRYAADRHIQVIPEINTPGHSRAAIVAMENRYRRFMKSENEAEAKRFLLSDMDDTSYYLSRQTYKNNVMSPCLHTTFDFLEVVAQTLYVMHQDIQPLKMIHFGGPGGDEFSANVWNNSKVCQELMDALGVNIEDDLKSHFVDSVAQKLPPEVSLGVWEDALMDEKRPLYRYGKNLGSRDVVAYAWDNIWEHGNGDNAHILANNDYKVVISHATDLFFDHPNEPDPEERGYYWASRFTNTRKVFGFTPEHLLKNAQVSRKGIPLTRSDVCPEFGCVELTEPSNIIGMQGQLWTETMRHPDQLEYMAAPRILALAERAWHKADWEDIEDKISRDRERDRDWEEFGNTLAYQELQKLDDMDFKYRIPPPGAEIKNSVIHTNSEIPGLPIQISLDNKKTWRRLNGTMPVPDNKLIHLRTTSPDGRRHSRVVTVTPAISRTEENSVFKMPFLERFLKYLGLSLIQ